MRIFAIGSFAALCVGSILFSGCGAASAPDNPIVFYDTFSEDPQLRGWELTGGSAEWLDGEDGGVARVLGGCWTTRMLSAEPFVYYKIELRTRSLSEITIPGAMSVGYIRAEFFDLETGEKMGYNMHHGISPSKEWTEKKLILRSLAVPSGDGYKALGMRIGMCSHNDMGVEFDDIRVEKIDQLEVARYCDQAYSDLPASIDYRPVDHRWQYLPRTKSLLEEGGRLRILMLGDSIIEGVANSNFEALIARAYPQSRIELICSTKGGTGVDTYKSQMQEAVFRYEPDLVIVGGISNGKEYIKSFRSVIEQIKAYNEANGSQIETLLLSKGWSPNSYPVRQYYFFGPNKRELTQAPKESKQQVVSGGYSGQLLVLANELEVAFLDLKNILSEYVYGPATAAGVGPPEADGQPYSYWMRDYIHGNYRAMQVAGRVMEAFFAPDDGADSP